MNRNIQNCTVRVNSPFSREDVNTFLTLYSTSSDLKLLKKTPTRSVYLGQIFISGISHSVLIKEYRFSLLRRIKKPFLPHRAKQAWHGANLLKKINLLCPNNIALIEYKTAGIVTKAILLTEFIKNAESLDVFVKTKLSRYKADKNRETVKTHLLETLSAELIHQHKNHIYNRDMKAENILVSTSDDQNIRLSYIDLEGVSFQPILPLRIKIRNLMQLSASIGRNIRLSERRKFLQTYLGDKHKKRIDNIYVKVAFLSRNWIRRPRIRQT